MLGWQAWVGKRATGFAVVLSVCLALLAPLTLAQDTEEVKEPYIDQWHAAWTFYAFFQVLEDVPLIQEFRRHEFRELRIEIDRPIEEVFEFLSHMPNHQLLQPFVKGMYFYDQYLDDDGLTVVEFTAVEDIPIGIFTLTNPVFAKQRINYDEFYYETDSWSLPNVVLHVRDEMHDLGNGRTEVIETIEFIAHEVLIDFTVQEGMNAHQETFDNLKALLEDGVLPEA